MRFVVTALVTLGAFGAAAFLVLVPEWTHPPVPALQYGPGPSMIQFGRGQMPEPVRQDVPAILPAAAPGGPMATESYKNVQVLTDVSAAEFMRLQQAITEWVAPRQGCAFCHAGDDYASDAKPQKGVARVMLQMVRHVNADWSSHVGTSGVTCWTCHRGQPIPAEAWFPRTPAPHGAIAARQENWNEAADNVRKFFPDSGWELFMLGDEPIPVQSVTALPSHTVASAPVAARVYEMMMQMSDGIGVNCGFCHNSRALSDWNQSTPQRWTGQSGLDMTRELNRAFFGRVHAMLHQSRERVDETTLPVLPAHQSGPLPADAYVICASCHMALPKPLNGASITAAYPGLVPAAQSQGATP